MTALAPTRPAPWCPVWWLDAEVKAFVIERLDTHRPADLVRMGQALFGQRFPSKSALYRFAARSREFGQALTTIQQIEREALALDEVERAALACRLLSSIATPDMGPALAMTAAIVRDQARDLTDRILTKGDVA